MTQATERNFGSNLKNQSRPSFALFEMQYILEEVQALKYSHSFVVADILENSISYSIIYLPEEHGTLDWAVRRPEPGACSRDPEHFLKLSGENAQAHQNALHWAEGAPEDMHLLTPAAWESVTLPGRSDFEGVIHLRIWRWGGYSRLCGWFRCNHRVLIRRRQERRSWWRDMRKSLLATAGFAEGGSWSGKEIWTASRSWKRQDNGFSPRDSRNSTDLLANLTGTCKAHLGLQTFGTERQ